jgi:[protein-PII] uridylyltransferase
VAARDLIDPEFRADPINRAAFLKLLQSDRGIVHEFRRMNQLDILGAYLPNFGRIVGQMQHDLFHVYTVDQHILQVLRNLRRFSMSEFAHEYPLCSRIIAEFERPGCSMWPPSSTTSPRDAAAITPNWAPWTPASSASTTASDEDTELVVWLVRNHLIMSQVAQKEDLTDPDVIANFVRLVGDTRHLQALYLLTHADIRGTSPKVWNHWKGKLLADLYYATLNQLNQGEAPAPHGIIAERQVKRCACCASSRSPTPCMSASGSSSTPSISCATRPRKSPGTPVRCITASSTTSRSSAPAPTRKAKVCR